jgi:hypothetical protein
MQEREFNRATFEVAHNRDISGRATADEINRGLQTGKERSFWRIACLTFLGSLTVAALFVVLAPLPANADNEEGSRHGREDSDKGIRAEITALQAQVTSLQATVSALQGQVNKLQTSNTGLQNQVNSLQASNTTLQNQLANAKNVLALDPFVRVDPNPEIGVRGPNIIFSGANIHIVSGSGSTDDNGNRTGLGNLIIGYDEDPGSLPGGPPLKPGERGGSHNLDIGRGNRFTNLAFGGLVVGDLNTISNLGTSVSGGSGNTASGQFASVLGGANNTASGLNATVSGGNANTSNGASTSILGGLFNTAMGGPPSTLPASWAALLTLRVDGCRSSSVVRTSPTTRISRSRRSRPSRDSK